MSTRRKNPQSPLTFIDLFAGIGGVRTAFTRAGGKCILSSDWDKYAQITYQLNYGEKPFGDVCEIDEVELPDFDILCGGFPCQPFSIAGVSKKNSLGKKHGFEDEKQGNLFFEIIRILKYKQPKVIFLENVKNLKSHDKGNTWRIVKANLEQLGYVLFDKVIDAKYYVPQHRERVFIVGFHKNHFPNINFEFPEYPKRRLIELSDVLDKNPDPQFTLSNHLWNYLQDRKKKQKEKGNGFGFGLIDPDIDEYTRTLSARYHKDGSEILIAQRGNNPRRLSPKECSRLMGFPDDFIIQVSNTQAYRQFGNSVVIPVIQAIADKIFETISEYKLGGNRKVLVFQEDLFTEYLFDHV